jgi:hypothetical protein
MSTAECSGASSGERQSVSGSATPAPGP